MFRGNFTHTVDSKGRVFLPAKWREELTENVVIAFDESMRETGSLQLCSADVWDKRFDKYDDNSDPMDPGSGEFLSALASTASDVEVDKMGRVLIPKMHLTRYGIETEVVISGDRNRIRLWKPESYEAFITRNAENSEEGRRAIMNRMDKNGQQ